MKYCGRCGRKFKMTGDEITNLSEWRADKEAKHLNRMGLTYRHLRPAAENIWWSDRDQRSYSRPDKYKNADLVNYGRCKSGRRWFWTVNAWRWRHGDDCDIRIDGWADNEQAAFVAIYAEIARIAEKDIVVACYMEASHRLREINRVKRAGGPQADGSDSRITEYLYSRWSRDPPFRITKKTATRIYYVKKESEFGDLEKIGFAPRRLIADEWPATWKDQRDLEDQLGWRNAPRWFLQPAPVGFYDRGGPHEPNLAELKVAMAAAHPDRGGSSEAFIEARARFVAARRAARRAAVS